MQMRSSNALCGSSKLVVDEAAPVLSARRLPYRAIAAQLGSSRSTVFRAVKRARGGKLVRKHWTADEDRRLRGIPTEETLEQMRTGDSPVHYLVGTPKGRLSKFEKKFLTLPWQAVRPSVDVKLLSHDSELYILARSHPRTLKERAMRRRRLKKLWRRLHELQQQTLTRDALLLKLGAAKKEAGRAYHLVDIQIPDPKQPVTPETFTFSLRRDKLRTVRRREGRYLLRSNLRHEDPATLWQYYIRLTEVEQAFKELKHDLAIRPIYHQTDQHIEAHIFIAFIAYCLHVTLKQHARSCAPGLTPRAVLEKFATMQMVDVWPWRRRGTDRTDRSA